MKTLITTLNAKYIHTALAIRLLYVASYPKHDVALKEYTIKQKNEDIVQDILSQQVDAVAFSTYIWNVEPIKDICKQLKQAKPEIIILLGGPEVSYEPEHFLTHFDIDYVLSGEGEITFEMLLEALEKKEAIAIPGVSYQGHIATEIPQTPLSYIETLPSPYILKQDEDKLAHRILYFETSRGCPFLCQYCLSSLEKGMRFYSHDYLASQLDLIFASPARIIKVLDRSFNAKMDHALFVLDYIFKHHGPHQQFQFEINADVFPQKIIDFINEKAPKGLLRFEIGIQSTYEPTNRAVKRIQNFERLSEVIKALSEGGKCDLHLDLIAGLPYETYERFAQSFDDVFAFRAKELQLGFLKMLRGTGLRNQADDYGYTYQFEAPYEMQQNNWISEAEIQEVHLAEEMLEKYWNSGRFKDSMNAIMDEVPSAFAFFHDLGTYYKTHHYPFHGYQPELLYQILDDYTNRRYHDLLIIDYLACCKTRMKRWYEPTLSHDERHAVIEALGEAYQLNRDELYRYARIEKLSDRYVIAIYKNYQCTLTSYPLNLKTTA